MRFNSWAWPLVVAAFIIFLIVSPVRAQTPDVWYFSTLPTNGNIAGEAGSTIGWGYTFTNGSSTNWLFVVNVLTSDPFVHASGNTAVFDLPIIAPGQTVMQPFVQDSAGLAELQWDTDAPLGFVNAGSFFVEGFWFDGNPLTGGQLLDSAGQLSAPYSATVVVGSEPESMRLVLSVALLIIFGSTIPKIAKRIP